jgi:hypothetical protein
MATNRSPFVFTDIAIGEDMIGEPFQIPVMVVDGNAFTEAEWNREATSAHILRDPTRNQWCFLGGYKPVTLTST